MNEILGPSRPYFLFKKKKKKTNCSDQATVVDVEAERVRKESGKKVLACQ
jgi:hypothetical protein